MRVVGTRREYGMGVVVMLKKLKPPTTVLRMLSKDFNGAERCAQRDSDFVLCVAYIFFLLFVFRKSDVLGDFLST